jgi:sugar/nucleoside kinase (ribokinase family)
MTSGRSGANAQRRLDALSFTARYDPGVIVVIGTLGLREFADELKPDGLAPAIASAATAAGARVELISKIGDDPAGDAVLIELARAGVGHVATLRDPSRHTPVRSLPDEPTDPTDPPPDANAEDGPDATAHPQAEDTSPKFDAADVELALRYLTDFDVLVVVHAAPDVLLEAVAAAGWSSAHLVVVTEPDADVPSGVPTDALVVAAAADDAEGVGARIGRYAAALARGDDAAAAYRDLTAAPAD